MNTSKLWRAASSVAIAAITLTLLSACSSQSTTAADCSVPTGDSSDTISQVTGASATAAKVSFPTPLSPTKTQVKVFTSGSGKTLSSGHIVELAVAGYNGATGKSLYHATGFGNDASDSAILLNPASSQLNKGMQQALGCLRKGEKLAAVIPAKELTNASGQSGFGLKAGQSAVFYFEVKDAYPDRATGAAQTPDNSFPTVTLAASGQPGIAALQDTKVTKLRHSTLKLGTGKRLGVDDTAVVQYTMFNASTGQVSSTTWGSDTAALWKVNAYPGLVDALDGATVGSQLIVMVPAAQAAEIDGTAAAEGDKVPAVIVVDILGTRDN